MKKLLLLLLPLLSLGQIQQTFQWTGDPNHYPSLNSFFTTKTTSLDKVLENSDFISNIITNSNPYSYNSIDGDVKIEDSPLPANVNKANAQLLNPLVTEFSFKKGDIGRTFLVLGYNSSTQICVVFLSWNTGTLFGRVCNYNLTNASSTQIVASSISNMTTNQIGSIKVVGDVIELYKDGVLTSSLNYSTLLTANAWVQNRCLGFGFHSYGTSGTATVTDANYILRDVALKGETVVEHISIFPTVNNGQISANGVWSSLQTFRYENQSLFGKDVVWVGDSNSDINGNYGGTLPAEKCPNVLKELHQLKLNNKSLGGRSVMELAHDLTTLNSLDENGTPDVILLDLGTNDFAADNVPLGVSTDAEKTTFWGACRFVLNHLKTRYPNSVIIYITPPHIGSTLYVNDATMTRIGSGVKFDDYLIAPRTICKELGIDVIDVFKYCKEINYQSIMQDNNLSTDKVHGNALWNQLKALYIERQLRRILQF